MIAFVTSSMPQEETTPSAIVCIKLSQAQCAQVKQTVHAVMARVGASACFDALTLYVHTTLVSRTVVYI